MASETVQISRVAKGKRPVSYPEEPAAERLLAIVSALVTEVAVLRDRQDTMERLADAKGLILADEIEAFEPDVGGRSAREAWRQAYMDRVFAILDQEVESAASGSAEGS